PPEIIGDEMKGYKNGGVVDVAPGRIQWNHYADPAKAASWTFSQPPQQMVVGGQYSWTLTAVSEWNIEEQKKNPANHPGRHYADFGKAAALMMGDARGLDVKKELSDSDAAAKNVATSDTLKFTFAPKKGTGEYQGWVGISGHSGAYIYTYAYSGRTGTIPSLPPNQPPPPPPPPAPPPQQQQPVTTPTKPPQPQTTTHAPRYFYERLQQANMMVSGVVLDSAGRVVSYQSHAIGSHPASVGSNRPGQGRHMDDIVFYLDPVSPDVTLPRPMEVPASAALIEAEVNTLLGQIFTLQAQIQQLSADCARHSDDYHRLISSDPKGAQAAAAAYQRAATGRENQERTLAPLQLRLGILNHFHIAR
ncbi:MAG: hypothetical protein JNG86_19490, partial [Verrucomicrobiaceae bacterium]|nr:hypothetical protein [Verrucomicrobiaceae bacterium]